MLYLKLLIALNLALLLVAVYLRTFEPTAWKALKAAILALWVVSK